MKNIFFTIVLIFIVLSISAQKEVYFNTTKPEDIQVESMQGFEVGSSISTISLFQPFYSFVKSSNIPLSMGYFCEKRIAPSWTLTTRIGFDHNFMNVPHYVFGKDSLQSINQKLDYYKFEYHLGLSLGIEPRWYFGYKKRYQVGKAKLNSGWFLSLPVSMGTTLINTYKPDQIDELSASYKSYCSMGISGALGYRQAITKQLFLEGNVQLLSTSSALYGLNNKIYLIKPKVIIFPGILIKAAYTFKK